MILASAQPIPEDGNIGNNLTDHYRFINMAADFGSELIVFPEMSVTGYLREDAYKFAFTENDKRLEEFKRLSAEKKIIIIAGAPLKINTDLFIGSFIISPNGSLLIYTKQFLYPGEELYFKPSSDFNPMLEINNERISFSTCFDIENFIHAQNASVKNSTIYIPSIFYSYKSINDAHLLLAGIAEKYSTNILMSNYAGHTWGTESGGKSAFWDKNGDLIASLDGSGSGLLIVKKNKDNWERLAILK